MKNNKNTSSTDILDKSSNQEVSKISKNYIQRISTLFSEISRSFVSKLGISDYKSNSRDIVVSTKSLYDDNNIYFVFFFIALVAKLVKIDASSNQAEEDAFLSEFTKRGYNIPDIKKLYESALNDEHDSVYYIKKIKMLYPNQKPIFLDIIALFLVVAASDGAINNLEFDYIKKIAKEFHIDLITLDKLFFVVLAPASITNPYTCLGINRSVDKDVATKAYRTMAKLYHPDNFISDDFICNEYKKIIQMKFNQVNDAFTQIKKEKKFK